MPSEPVLNESVPNAGSPTYSSITEGAQHPSTYGDGGDPLEYVAANESQPYHGIIDGDPTQEEVATPSSDIDSGFDPEDDDASSTASLSSTIKNAIDYHGHDTAAYYLPIDKVEIAELLHHIWVKKVGLCRAPFDETNLHRVLDAGTGCGQWAMDFAEKYPMASVRAIDISVGPFLFFPPNMEFEISDLEQTWNFRHLFDYIHGRGLAVCFNDFPKFLSQAFDNLRPGGYLELQDIKYPFGIRDKSSPAPYLTHLQTEVIKGAKQGFGQDWLKMQSYKKLMEAAGFVDIELEETEWVVGDKEGPERKDDDEWDFRLFVLEHLRWFSQDALINGLQEDPTYAEVSLALARNEVKYASGSGIKLFANIIVIYGRRP